MKSIKTVWPSYTKKEIDSVGKVLSSGKVNYWTGEECRNFEKEFALYSNTNYAIALSNGTVALELAIHALKLSYGDEIIVTSRTFIASVSCVVTSGAKPMFADVDLNCGNLSIEHISKVFTKKTKAIICVHLAGYPCDMDPIMDFAKNNDLFVIEDCSQAHGASYKGKKVGSIGDIGTWSFCQDKIISTGGEGGMVTTNNTNFWNLMWSYKDHGKNLSKVNEKNHNNGFKLVHDSFGTNMRMTEMQAVIGRSQLKKLDRWREIREKNSENIIKVCLNFPNLIRIPIVRNDINHAWYKCYVYLKFDGLKKGWSRDDVIFELNKLDISCFVGTSSEVYLEKAFEGLYRPENRLPNAKELGETSLMFLVHPTMTENELSKNYQNIKKVFLRASK
jgi:dTDP-4-amino-4,6-dideoxygalactose transaminase